ncbi:hypothetical protein [Methylobacterium oryzae]|uniref:hypothetical protein n=1 Tax=Methylobacterium oryzae TaxID=334852 RepID=UPI002F3605E5
MGVDYCLTMGAFSYAVSGYYFGADIARYCSIGESVQVGRGSHPVQCGSTSPLFYTHHSAVFDRLDPRAARDAGPAEPAHHRAPHRVPRPATVAVSRSAADPATTHSVIVASAR